MDCLFFRNPVKSTSDYKTHSYAIQVVVKAQKYYAFCSNAENNNAKVLAYVCIMLLVWHVINW